MPPSRPGRRGERGRRVKKEEEGDPPLSFSRPVADPAEDLHHDRRSRSGGNKAAPLYKASEFGIFIVQYGCMFTCILFLIYDPTFIAERSYFVPYFRCPSCRLTNAVDGIGIFPPLSVDLCERRKSDISMIYWQSICNGKEGTKAKKRGCWV